jgi:hypothetical protein
MANCFLYSTVDCAGGLFNNLRTIVHLLTDNVFAGTQKERDYRYFGLVSATSLAQIIRTGSLANMQIIDS